MAASVPGEIESESDVSAWAGVFGPALPDGVIALVEDSPSRAAVRGGDAGSIASTAAVPEPTP